VLFKPQPGSTQQKNITTATFQKAGGPSPDGGDLSGHGTTSSVTVTVTSTPARLSVTRLQSWVHTAANGSLHRAAESLLDQFGDSFEVRDRADLEASGGRWQHCNATGAHAGILPVAPFTITATGWGISGSASV
jgi:hypothetical protein